MSVTDEHRSWNGNKFNDGAPSFPRFLREGGDFDVLYPIKSQRPRPVSPKPRDKDGAPISANNRNDDDGRAGLSRIEIDHHGLVHGKQASLIGTKTDGGKCAVFEEGHECDLNRPSCPIQCTADLHRADRALNCGPRPDRAANEYIAATNRGQEK